MEDSMVIETNRTADQGLTQKQLTEKYDHEDGKWGEHPDWSMEDWQFEVSEGGTRLGYWDWVVSQIEQKSDGTQLDEDEDIHEGQPPYDEDLDDEEETSADNSRVLDMAVQALPGNNVWELVDRLNGHGIEVIIGAFPAPSARYNVELRRWRNRSSEGIPGDPHTGRSRETIACVSGEVLPDVLAAAVLRSGLKL
jgi:hypothetical protein